MTNEERPPTKVMAARCVSFRELSRSTAGLIDEIDRDGQIFALSRYGRLVALLVPILDRLIIEFDHDSQKAPAADDVDLDALELTDLAGQFLIDAASTRTGSWRLPETAILTDRRAAFAALDELDLNGLTQELSVRGRRITKKGRSVAKTLRERGDKGYGAVHDDPYLEP